MRSDTVLWLLSVCCQIVTTLVMSSMSALTAIYYISLNAKALYHETNYMYSDHTMVSTGVITLRLCMCVIMHVTQRQHGHVVVWLINWAIRNNEQVLSGLMSLPLDQHLKSLNSYFAYSVRTTGDFGKFDISGQLDGGHHRCYRLWSLLPCCLLLSKTTGTYEYHDVTQKAWP